MKERSLWMEGLLWAEEYVNKKVFFEDDETGIDSLSWELYHSGNFCSEKGEFFIGAEDYLKYLQVRLG